MTFDEYRRRVVSDERIGRGRELIEQHAPLLDRVERRYGVPAEVMVALWGIEFEFRRAPGQLFGVRRAGHPGLRGPAGRSSSAASC